MKTDDCTRCAYYDGKTPGGEFNICKHYTPHKPSLWRRALKLAWQVLKRVAWELPVFVLYLLAWAVIAFTTGSGISWWWPALAMAATFWNGKFDTYMTRKRKGVD